MNRNPFLIFFFLIMLTLSFTTLSHALLNRDVKKAKEFMAAGMYPQAIELLNKRINEKPTDAEAHFQLGICYINTGNYRKADERFGSAVRLEPEYGYKIGREYKKAGDEFLSTAETEKALRTFRNAVKYQPDLNKDIAKTCYVAGQESLKKNRIEAAKDLFKCTVDYEPSLRKEIAHECFVAGQRYLNQNSRESAKKSFSLALRFDPVLDKEVADFYYAKGELKNASAFNRSKYGPKYGEHIKNKAITMGSSKLLDEAKKYIIITDADRLEITATTLTRRFKTEPKVIYPSSEPILVVDKPQLNLTVYWISLKPIKMTFENSEGKYEYDAKPDDGHYYILDNQKAVDEGRIWIEGQAKVYVWVKYPN